MGRRGLAGIPGGIGGVNHRNGKGSNQSEDVQEESNQREEMEQGKPIASSKLTIKNSIQKNPKNQSPERNK